MQSFTEFNDGILTEATSLELDIVGVLKSHSGSSPVNVEDDHISTMVPTKEQLDRIASDLPTSVDYDVLVHSSNDFANGALTVIESDLQDEVEYEINEVDVNNNTSMFEIVIYTYNTSSEESLDEAKRVIKVNAKGKRRVKLQCKKGFKYTGNSCKKISGKELVNRRSGIRKSVRTKKSLGGGFTKRVARLANRAKQKRKSMGL